MNPIQYQTNVLWTNLSSKDTIKTYKQALFKTWSLFKETATLILMLFLLLVVFVVWIWSLGFRSGWGFRQWMESPNSEPKELVDATIGALTSSFTIVFNWIEDLVEKKLGLELPASDFKLLNPKLLNPDCKESNEPEK